MKNWIAVVAWSGLVFALVPTVRTLTTWIGAHFGDNSFIVATTGPLIIGVSAVLIGARRMGARISAASGAWLVVILGVAIWWSCHLQRPEEALHIIEYSILGGLLFNALRSRLKDASVFVVALLIGTIIGTADELFQWVISTRYFDYRDIWLNFGTLFLTQLAIAKGLAMPEAKTRPDLGAFKTPVVLLSVQLLLLVFCLSATPARILGWAQYLPVFQTLCH